MTYTKRQFVQDLKQKLRAEHDIPNLAQWGYLLTIGEYGRLEEGLLRPVSEIATMTADPQFEMSEEELWALTNELDIIEN